MGLFFLEGRQLLQGNLKLTAVQHKHPKGVVWVKHPFDLVILWVNRAPEEGRKYPGNTLNSNAPWASSNSLCSCMNACRRMCLFVYLYQQTIRPVTFWNIARRWLMVKEKKKKRVQEIQVGESQNQFIHL